MATNPMQRKARNSFILGVLVTFVIMAMIVALLLVQLKKMKEASIEDLRKVLNQEVAENLFSYLKEL